MCKTKRKFPLIKIIISGVLILFLIVLGILQNNVEVAEWWTRNIARGYQTFVGSIFKHLPFSFFEILAIALIITAIVLVVKIIIDLVKLRFFKALNKGMFIVVVALGMVTTYVMTTSLAYYRKPIPITLYEEKVDKSKFNEVVQYFLDDFNSCSDSLEYETYGEVKMPYSADELANKIALEYTKITDPYYSSFTTKPKSLLTSFLFLQFQITGVYVGITGEVNYDSFMTHSEYPFTFAHEIAHSKGVMRENDAQLLATYICLNSEDEFIRYSGYMYTFTSLLGLCRYTGNKDDYSLMRSQMNQNILLNYNFISMYWEANDLLSHIGEFFNNLYLQIFGNETTDSYDDTPVVVNPNTNEITSFSRYQKLYFQKYIDNGGTL